VGGKVEARPAYLSYLLRLWRVSGEGRPHRGDGESHPIDEQGIWRASLESSHIGGRKVFASLDDLFDFLQEQTGEQVEEAVEEQADYLSYLLRLWREDDGGGGHREDAEPDQAGGKAVWRASLESVRTGERRSFASLEELFDFLREQAGC
jgi:hypothetical protein